MKNLLKSFKRLFGSTTPKTDRKGFIRVSDEEKKQMKKDFKDGMHINDIAKKFGRPSSVISYWVTSHQQTTKKGKAYKLSPKDRRKARNKYKLNRPHIMRLNHKKHTPKHHDGCPVCFEVDVPANKTIDQVIDEWVYKNQKINLAEISFAKQKTKCPKS